MATPARPSPRPGPRGRAGGPEGSRVSALLFVGVFAAAMWVVEGVDAVLPANLDAAGGITPRSTDGLTGVVTSPFLHGSLAHLVGNTVPFLALGASIAMAGLARIIAVTAIVALIGGLGTWLTSAPGTVTIGASGIVFGYAAYLIARGLFSRRPLQLALGVLVVIVLGGSLLSGLAPQQGISWQAHLFGAIGGLVAARTLAVRDRRRSGPPPAGGYGTPAWDTAAQR